MSKYILQKGYIDQAAILADSEKNNCPFIIEIGSRQIGKTYGTLKLLLERGKKFILMRRTQTEADFICNGAVNPFSAIDQNITIKKSSRYTGTIMKGGEEIGIVLALSTVSKIRGFSGRAYKDLVYDEFIPERHVMKMRYEGEAFLNAIVTISGNREIDGEDPLRVWLLANSNNVDNPILRALRIQEKVVSMIDKGQELSIMPERGILIFMPSDTPVMEKRKSDSINKAVKDGAFIDMAYSNQFSFNDHENVRRIKGKELQEYNPVFSVTDICSVFRHKSQDRIYVSSDQGTGFTCPDNERNISLIRKRYRPLINFYIRGNVFFQDSGVKENFKNLFNIN